MTKITISLLEMFIIKTKLAICISWPVGEWLLETADYQCHVKAGESGHRESAVTQTFLWLLWLLARYCSKLQFAWEMLTHRKYLQSSLESAKTWKRKSAMQPGNTEFTVLKAFLPFWCRLLLHFKMCNFYSEIDRLQTLHKWIWAESKILAKWIHQINQSNYLCVPTWVLLN